jgi:hypothetical protein
MAKPKKKPQGDGAVAIHEPIVGSAAPQNTSDTTTAAAPDRDRIALRAYELYLARGGGDGAAMDDWLTAEQELGARSILDRPGPPTES